MKVLVVDDEREIASLFQDYLETDGGHEVSTAYSGPEALEKLQNQKPDLIILDIMMPGLSGFQVLGAIRRNPQTADIPVILSSATDGPTHDEKKQLGLVDFLRKPIDFTKLTRIVNNLECSSTPKDVSQDAQVSHQGKVEHSASVLIIEDDPDDLELLSLSLKNMGCTVRSAMDGAYGLKLANEILPDLIILDYLLPIKDGLDVIKELKASDKTYHIPVILVSAYIPSNSKEKVFMLRENLVNSSSPLSAKDLFSKIKEIFSSTGTGLKV